MANASIVQGSTFDFVVVAKNQFGDVVPITDANVVLDDPSLGTVGVNTDGSAGVFTSDDGTGVEGMTPSAAGITGPVYTVEITPDMTVASVEIVSPTTPTSVSIQRRGASLRRR